MKKNNKNQWSDRYRTSFSRFGLALLAGSLFLMFIITIITTIEQDKYFSSRYLHTWSSHVQKELLGAFFSYENRHFLAGEGLEKPNVSSMVFEFMTNLNVEDPRTLLRNELPGFAAFDGRIVVAGDGTDFTTMPVESAPPLEILLEKREATTNRLELLEDQKEKAVSGEPVVHIVHSHSRESYLPELEDGTNVAFHPDVNVTLVGERLGKKLEEKGIATKVDKTDIEKKLHESGKDFSDSYDISREVVQTAMSENDKLELFFDLHRDSQPRDVTTVTINDEKLARTMFVIGENHASYEQNLAMATALNNKLDEQYPGLSRGIITKGGTRSNGRYNQDLSEQSVLIEMGGKDNTLDEVYKTADIMAEVISEYYMERQAEPVGGEGDK
ncbi:stage II sporulation protein P [Alteribacillus iranensis]|uniref:Stage II sporulation protein P n=1 Tax=Alteribacillus iranensis TaxID=930128 RepID=A0A1I1ZA03_9BACI|nr:stage II sporulation protein P [Alteribacillus iranensis]SFE28596.1 stage II sporulation protein P [Alteribacillus iranensis]